MTLRITPHKLYFILLQGLSILFWGIPEIFFFFFKIALLLFLAYVFIYFVYKKQVNVKNVLLLVIFQLALFLSGYLGSFQSNIINIALSATGIMCLPLLVSPLTEKEKKSLRHLCYFLCFLMFIQLLIFRSKDGRPSLGYELNFSGAYLFLFFLYSDYLKFKFGKLFVICASFLLLSRLLILSIICFYVIRFVQKVWTIRLNFNWRIFLFISYIAFFIFNVWFLLNVEKGVAYDSSVERLGTLNDNSNVLRFTINVAVLNGVLQDSNLRFGYGQVTDDKCPEYTERYTLMPHNELLDSIVEFGYVFTIISFVFSTMYIRKFFKYQLFCYFIPCVIYTLILWVRFWVVPSLEMFFLYSLLMLKMNEHEKNITNS